MVSEEQVARGLRPGALRRGPRRRPRRAGAPRAGRVRRSPGGVAAAARRAARPAGRGGRQAARARRAHAGGQQLVANTLHCCSTRGASALVADVQAELEALAVVRGRAGRGRGHSAVDLHAEAETSARAPASRRPRGAACRLAKKVDPDIIGGLVLRVGDVIVDGSCARPHPPAAPSTGDGRTER